MKSRGVRIVRPQGMVSGRNVDVFDLETGAKLLNIYRIELDISRDVAKVTITSGDPWVYEGPADFVTPEEAKAIPAPEDELTLKVIRAISDGIAAATASREACAEERKEGI